MRVLALSDQVLEHFYSPAVKERFAEAELVVGCGDLPSYYLEYIVSMLNVPILQVPGNHDPAAFPFADAEDPAAQGARRQGWGRLILVSDPLHLARAAALAQGLDMAVACRPAQDCPPPSGSPAWWARAAAEGFLLLWYRTGMAYSRLIRSRRQLARVT